jgi:diaminopimelate decarboxylase
VTLSDIVRAVRTETSPLLERTVRRRWMIRGGTGLDDLEDRSGALQTIDESVVLRRCSLYQKAFPEAEITYPVAALRLPAVATWVRRHGRTVDVRSGDELDRAISAGVHPVRVVMHRDDATASPIRRSVNIGVGRFVVNSPSQVALLVSCAERSQRVVVDVTSDLARETIDAVLAQNRVNLIGLHSQLGISVINEPGLAEVVGRMIAQMAQIRRYHNVLLTRLSVAGGTASRADDRARLRRLNDAIEDAVDDSCARWRFPRPLLVLSPGLAILLPAI